MTDEGREQTSESFIQGWTSQDQVKTHKIVIVCCLPCTVVLSEGHWVAGQVQGTEWAVPQSSQSPQGTNGVLRQTKVLHCGELWQLTQTHQVVTVQV